MSGFEVLKSLRQWSNLPVITMTARDQDIDRIVGLEIGADDYDYLGRPVSRRELVARVRAVLRRLDKEASMVAYEVAVSGIRLNPASWKAWVADNPVELNTAEFNLLEDLLRHAGHVVTRADLSAAAFGRSFAVTGTDRNVDTLVRPSTRNCAIVCGWPPV